MTTIAAIDLQSESPRDPHDRKFLVPLPADANGAVATAAVASKQQADALAKLIAFAPLELLVKAGFRTPV